MRTKKIEFGNCEYEIYEDGRVYSYAFNRFLTGSENSRGYLEIKNRQKCKRIHRLVAEAFIPNPNKLPVVNHKDGNKLNNHVDNLEWATVLYNNYHAIDNGLSEGYGTEMAIKILDYMEICDPNENFVTIADKFNVSHYFVNKLYRGQIYAEFSEDRTLVEFIELGITEKMAEDVCKFMSENPTATYKDVNEKFKLSESSIQRIRTGKLFPEIANKYNLNLRVHHEEEIIIKICEDLINTKDTYETIAKRYDVSKSTVMRVKNKKSFKHITDNYDFSCRNR